MPTGLVELAIVVLIAAVFGVVAKLLKQPLVLAYIATGVVIAFFNFFNFADKEIFHVFSSLGVMFLLFLVGLEMNYTSLRLVKKVSLIVGLGQVLFTFIFGYLISLALGFSSLHAAYVAIALTFSSTVIIVKLISDKKELHSLYGRISVGLLLVQDLLVVLILVFLSGVQSGDNSSFLGILLALGKGVVIFPIVLFVGRRIVPVVLDKVARSQELLFLSSLAWVFFAAALMQKVGFSVEIGGFLAGLAIANSSESFQIAGRVKPLRDFFILIFFVTLGSSMAFSGFGGLVVPVVVLSLFVLVGNPVIVFGILSFLGYRKRTSFLTGVTVAQVSEFSFILMALGFAVGHVTSEVVALITAVGAITIIVSAYMIVYVDRIFKWVAPVLSFFERKKLSEEGVSHGGEKKIVLVGCHRTGQSIAFNLPKKDVLVVDFDPEVIKELERHGFDSIFGDVSDPDVFERIDFGNIQFVISTSPHLESNLALLSFARSVSNRPRVILRAEREEDAGFLYDKGADYVLLPHFTAGQYLGKTIAVDPEMTILDRLREKDLTFMRKVSRKV